MITLRFVYTIPGRVAGDDGTFSIEVPDLQAAEATLTSYTDDARTLTVNATDADGTWLGNALVGDGECRYRWT